MKKTRLVIANKFRFTVFLISVILFSSILTGLIFNLNTAEGAQNTEFNEIYVKNGDTLWSIAKEYGPDNEDIRKVIYEISNVNKIDNDIIYTGQKILIPVYN